MLPEHCNNSTMQICAIPQYGAKVQLTLPQDGFPRLNATKAMHLQPVIDTLIYYAQAVDFTMIVPLGSLAESQTKATRVTLEQRHQFLHYTSTYPDAKVQLLASPLILTIHSDAYILFKSQARSSAGDIFYLSRRYDPNTTNPSIGAIHITIVILKLFMPAAAETELAALLYKAQEAFGLRVMSDELGHPQPPTAIQKDNK
jgi:hypothetical protein